jgi:SPX domain protein involved in polyphosphate accumulation
MKFGATLSRRSVPQWRTHDLDYDEIKLLIKEQTSSPAGCSREFERNLLAVLDTELERIDEFVRCKAGEIERRLAACQRTVKSLLRERTTSGGDATTDSEASPLKKVVKFEGEIDRYHPRFYRLGGSTC